MAKSQQSSTLRDVAELAGVSVSSASRALSGRGDLRRDTRARVFNAARALGYDRADEPRGRPTTLDPRLIELVLGSFDDAWTDAVTKGAREAAFRLGFDLVLTLERDDPEEDWPARVATRRPSGVILGIIRPTRRQLDEFRGLRIPLVLLDPRSDPEGAIASVGTTDFQGGYAAGAHLVAGDAERFVIIAGAPAYRFGRAREDGFRQAIIDHAPGSAVERVTGDWGSDTATDEMVRALSSPPGRVGVFASNDAMALAAYRAAARAGLRIPEEVSVVGFNDDPDAATASPPLTTVRQPLQTMAARAVELIRDMRHHEVDHYERIEIESTLIVRASTRPGTPG